MQTKMKKTGRSSDGLDLPYKKVPISRPIAENVEKATNKYSGGDNSTSTGKYEMIITASKRAKDIALGAKPIIESIHKPAVTALLEIEAGLVGKDYVSTHFK